MRGIAAIVGMAAMISTLSIPAPAIAQDYLGAHLQAQRHDNLRRHQQRIARKRLAERRLRAMSPHQQACAKRYRSYDPRTDRYVIRPGMTARCTL